MLTNKDLRYKRDHEEEEKYSKLNKKDFLAKTELVPDDTSYHVPVFNMRFVAVLAYYKLHLACKLQFVNSLVFRRALSSSSQVTELFIERSVP
jgi:hypothetical protein